MFSLLVVNNWKGDFIGKSPGIGDENIFMLRKKVFIPMVRIIIKA